MTNVRTQIFRPRNRALLGMVATAALVLVVIQQSWGHTPLSGSNIVSFLLTGLALGSIYGVAAQGLVVTYTTSGVFNFAQGAIGMFMAYVYWEFKVDIGLPTVVAVAITVLIMAPLFGVIVERLLMRHLVDAPLVSQLVVTIGLMLALLGLASSIWDPNVARTIPRFFGMDGIHIGGTFLPYFRLITILTGIAVGIGLRFLLYYTRLGLTMRAVVDNRDLTQLTGARPARASMTAWALGSSMAALAGIFLSEELSAVDVTTLTLFIVDAFAAGIIAKLKSLPMAYVGGLVIGLSLSFQQNFLDWSGRWTAAPNAIPAVILFIALLFVSQRRLDSPRSRRSGHERVPSLKYALLGFAILLLVVTICSALMSRSNVRDITVALLTAFVMLSLVPLTGWANQISLAQITLMGFASFALVEWGAQGNLVDLLLAAAFAVPVGVLMAFPALRLRGLYLALTTMAFARMAEFLFFDQPEVFGSSDRPVSPLSVFGWQVNEPFKLLGISFPQDAGFLIVATIIFGIVGMLVVWARRSSLGRRLIAMRDSSAACVTIGMNLTTLKLAVFAFSAAIAGVAGALFAFFYGSVGTAQFQLTAGLPYLLLLVVGGVSLVAGSVFGGVALASFTWIGAAFPGSAALRWFTNIGPGLAGIGIGRNPDGAVVEWQHRLHKNHDVAVAHAPEEGDDQRLAAVRALPRRSGSDVPVLALSDVSVRFGGLQALREVSIDLREGAIVGLIGPNGAGKTTLFNVASGLQEPVSGRVYFDGEDVTGERPYLLARRGLARTFQRLEVFGSLSVRDNVRVAAAAHRRQSGDKSLHPDRLTDTIIDWLGLRSVSAVRADQLPTGTARLVEMARALATRPRVLLLDEPSSGLSAAETDQLAAVLRRLTSTGLAVLLVEHDMGFIMDLCAHIVVLDAGATISQGPPSHVQSDPVVLEAYLGSPGEQIPTPARPLAIQDRTPVVPPRDAAASPALELSGVSAGYGGIRALFDVDFSLGRGEVCAVLGPNGAGKSTLLKVASAQLRPTSGTVLFGGHSIAGMSPDELSRHHLAVVPEGRGVFPNLTVIENLKMATYSATTSYGEILEHAFERFPKLGTRRRQLAGTLSGGEQQMLAIARALAVRPQVLLLDELSMGLAPIIVGEFYDVIAQIAAEGLSILVVEQFAHEVLRVADRAALLVHGRITQQGTPEQIDSMLHSSYLAATHEHAGHAMT